MKSLFLALALIGPLAAQAQGHKVIYGQDNRVEVSEYGDALFREKAQSVAGMVSRYQLKSAPGSSVFNFNDYMTLENAMNVCSSERFADQVVLPSCTGFLVAPDVLVTAGHCVPSYDACRENVWVFGYTNDKNEIPKQDVYTCRAVIGQKLTLGLFAHKDYAVIKLDRPVKERAPLKYRKKGRAGKGDKVLVIGHPSGLPLKIADNAEIMTSPWNTFRTNLDTYAGNSGSPVFSVETGEVEGILIQGANDYENSGLGCNVSARRDSNRSDSKERVFRITKVKEL